MARVVRKPGPGTARLEALLKNLANAHSRVGWLENATYENGTPAAYIAVIHENGVEEKNIPPRPMLRPTVDEHQGEWRELAAKIAQRVISGDLSLKEGLGMLAAKAAGNLQVTIGEITSPALAEKTIEARRRKKERGLPIGSLSKPMQETDFLRSSVKFDVRDGKGEQE
ncbi:hypothetical protein LJC36_00230 [Desulfovibrio sp. OttesenSCG-928-C14]|nr:hypothetical protein [Desulfovibrio sp. OttesenSCG-928-C14]